MTVQQLIAELEERDPEASVIVIGDGDIIDIEYTDDGKLNLIGEYEI